MLTWDFYEAHATVFVREFGMMPFLLKREQESLGRTAFRILIAKLSLIHTFRIELAAKKRSGGSNG